MLLPFCQTQQTDTAWPWGFGRPEKLHCWWPWRNMYVCEDTCGTSEATSMLLFFWREHIWEISPSFVLLLVNITVFGCRRRVWWAVPIESCCQRAEPLELLCSLQPYVTQQQSARLCIKQKNIWAPDAEGLLARCTISEWRAAPGTA